MESEIWALITSFLSNNKRLLLLTQSVKTNFHIETMDGNCIVIRFVNSNNKLKIERTRFISAYTMLKENRNNWILIGASRIETKDGTLEGRIKRDYNGNMNGTSTAPWVAAILVNTVENIAFNNKKRGQAIMLIDNEKEISK